MSSTGQPEPASAVWVHARGVFRWMGLAVAVTALFGVVADTPKWSLPQPEVGSLVPSEASEAPGPERRLEQPIEMRGSVPNLSSRGHILIPAIGVDALLIPLGLTPDNALDVPKDWGVAGWFEGGPFPGEPGPAVVVGHVDSTSGPAVFYRLRELRRGDVIVVWRKGGVRSRFRVESLSWFSKSAFPTQLVYGAIATPALRLITCGGAFDHSTGHYVDNLVVFASPMTDS
jgi:sortase (surface protein transpeptidase)